MRRQEAGLCYRAGKYKKINHPARTKVVFNLFIEFLEDKVTKSEEREEFFESESFISQLFHKICDSL